MTLVKVTGSDRRIESSTVERTMGFLHVLADAIKEPSTGDFALQSDCVKSLVASARDPEKGVDANIVIGMSSIKHNIFGGDAMCRFLFGPGYEEKMRSGEALRIINDDARAIIAAANPHAVITFRSFEGLMKHENFKASPPSFACVYQTMRSLSAIASAVRKEAVKGNAVQTDAVKQMLWHAREPHLPIDADIVRNISEIIEIKGREISGDEVCRHLFGADYKAKLQNNQPLGMPDPEVRLTVAAAKPHVLVRCKNPLDMSDTASRSYDQSIRNRMMREEHDRDEVLQQDPDTYGRPLLKKPQHWRSELCFADGQRYTR